MFRLISVLLALACVAAARGDETSRTPGQTRDDFTYARAIVTGIVEGVTEYLPVSSTGHMIVSDRLMKVPDDENIVVAGVTDRKGRPVTLARVADDYIVIIQIGAIAAVLVVFFGRIRRVVAGLLRGEKDALRLTTGLLLAFLPAAIVGLLFKEAIAAALFHVEVVACALIGGGFLILIVERRLPAKTVAGDEVAAITPRQALVVGLCQCVALIPGTSRSLATIIGGRFAGLSNAAATEFSFLVGLITLSAASVYKMWALGPALREVYPSGPATLGLAVAAITAFGAVKWMVGFVSRRGLSPFAWYRIALGTVILTTLLF